MAESKKTTVTLEELIFSSLAQTDALAKPLIAKASSRSGTLEQGAYPASRKDGSVIMEESDPPGGVAISSIERHLRLL